MNDEAACEFVDANVLVYAFDASAGPKQAHAAQLLERLWDTGRGCLSVQVLQEFFVTVTLKVRHCMTAGEAAERVRELAAWRVFSPAADDVLAAIALHEQAQLSFRDAMIVHAAAELGCGVLWSEDLQDGRVLRAVRISNPFAVRK